MATGPVLMKKLRQRMKIVMWVVAIAFIGLMVFNWGRDISGERSRRRRRNEVGRVNDEPITLRELEDAYRNALGQFQRSRQPITDEIEENIRQSAWGNLVQSKLLMARASAFAVDKVGALELYENIRRNPPDFLRQQEAFQTDGRFDYAKFETALKDPRQPWEQIEAIVQANLPFQKLQQVIQLMTFISPTEVREAYERMSDSVKVQYAKLGPWGLSGFSPDTSAETLKAYYERNKETYKREVEQAVLEYILIPLEANSRDSAIAERTIREVYEELKKGEDFAYLARAYSEDYRTVSQGGDMGFFPEIVLEGKFATAFSSLKPGEFSEPFIEGNGWHIVKLIETEGSGDSLFLHGARIFVQIMPRETTRDSVRSLAEKIWNMADSVGLGPALDSLGLSNFELQTTRPFDRFGAIDGVGGHSELAAFAFSADTTALFRLIPAVDGIYIYQFKKRIPAGYPALEEIQEIVEGDMIIDQKREFMQNRIKDIYRTWQEEGAVFAELKKRYNLQLGTTILFTRESYLNEPTPDAIFKAYAFRLKEEGEISPPFVDDIGDGYILRLVKRIPPDWQAFSEHEQEIMGRIYQEKREKLYNKWFEVLVKRASIEDFRSSYY